MRERSVLTDWCLIVNCRDPANKGIVERHLSDYDPILCRLANFVPDLEIDLVRHPLIERRNAHSGKVVPFRWVRVLGCGVSQLLNEGKNIHPRSKFPDWFECCFRVFEKLISLPIQEPNSDEPSAHTDFFAANFERPLSF